MKFLRRKIIKPISFLFSFLGLQTMKAVFIVLPWDASIKFGMFCTGLAAKLMKKRFRNNMQSIARALPEKSEKEVYEICMGSWRNMGAVAAEFIKCARMSKEKLLQITELRNTAFVYERVKNNSPMIIHSGHFPNWEVFNIASDARGLEKAVVAQGLKNPFIDKELERMRGLYGGRIINTDNPFFACVKWLKSGKSLAILSDQNAYKSEVYRKFFGRWCACSPLTPLLSIKLQIPVVPAKLYRENGKFIVEFLDPVIPPLQYSQETVENMVDVLNKYYEGWIRERPADWLWAHNRWKREKNAPQYEAEHANG
ncbi:MAG: lysophospholipid acyltransferase family protein [Elusimicrobium sp.]|jgi:KDO2-lipid IV(A) lauroyltransferase|nr:lysophospholipid acyltransferase family protein [Elusimicrobium sp.]